MDRSVIDFHLCWLLASGTVKIPGTLEPWNPEGLLTEATYCTLPIGMSFWPRTILLE